MSAEDAPKRVRADAERSTARILEAAQSVLAGDPNASLERIADAAGLARATVHRRFSSRKALHDALVADIGERYRQAVLQARVATAPPLVALHRLAQVVFELKVSHRFAVELASDEECGPVLSGEVREGIELLFRRLREVGAITAEDPLWCRQLMMAVLHAVHVMPPDSPALGCAGAGTGVGQAGVGQAGAGVDGAGVDGAGLEGEALSGARADLLVETLTRALGGGATAG
ncbi:TetR/AcrR family transcriptional regulator [Actinosynnema mirum]|uniref:Transcriptional regulator, TetR family n=1 Tax=Actinosynnema mirum (strain ATCC 29888 / DSM 43827 / JCM 3225 / NBRC 14064 / NCIMB 13271 / NRRL B-12336 / IMRU 3971 / 101) TaxID=446462 RepID=C6WJY7_ACTMD|nr:TetR/AcrR family transcriptional regulator [Actinosynnema mirum]ACU36362.1 transcriptional regulator, TetR family [Actinosynnema mirum DSM 43827]